MKVLIVGCGYVGMELAAGLLRQEHTVWGVRRNQAGLEELRNAGIIPVAADLTDTSSLAALPTGCDWVVNCAGASGSGPQEYRRVYVEGNRNLLDWLRQRPPEKFVYTSSTGVYSQDDGSTVDETSPTLPASGTAAALLEAERLLLDAAHRNFPAVILRVAGIYGPGRGYWLRQFLAGTAEMEGAGARRLNMIHRDDVAAAIITALEHGKPGEIYNAVDDEPPTQRMVYEWLSARLNRPLPPVRAHLTQSLTGRAATDKIVSNRKLRQLGWKLQYPTFREGYEAEVQRMPHP